MKKMVVDEDPRVLFDPVVAYYTYHIPTQIGPGRPVRLREAFAARNEVGAGRHVRERGLRAEEAHALRRPSG